MAKIHIDYDVIFFEDPETTRRRARGRERHLLEFPSLLYLCRAHQGRGHPCDSRSLKSPDHSFYTI